MAFFDDLGKKLTQVSQEAAQQTKIFAETTKINGLISDEEKQIGCIFAQLGKAYFEDNKDNPTATYRDLVVNVLDAQVRIEQYKEQILQIKGIKSCPTCGAEVSAVSAFCSSCGAKMPEPVLAAKTARCPQCGAEVSEDGKFCDRCGCNLESASFSTPPNSFQSPDGSVSSPINTIPSPTEDISKPINTIPSPTEDISKPINTIPSPIEDISKPTDTIPSPTEDFSTPITPPVDIQNSGF